MKRPFYTATKVAVVATLAESTGTSSRPQPVPTHDASAQSYQTRVRCEVEASSDPCSAR